MKNLWVEKTKYGRMGKRAAALLAVMIMVLNCGVISAWGCTGVYIGKDVSVDGSVILARSNDTQGVLPNYIDITERVENVPGRTLPVDLAKTVWADIPATTYRYTSTPFMDSAKVEKVFGRDVAAVSNEYGVIMSPMSLTTSRALRSLLSTRLMSKSSRAASLSSPSSATRSSRVRLLLCRCPSSPGS